MKTKKQIESRLNSLMFELLQTEERLKLIYKLDFIYHLEFEHGRNFDDSLIKRKQSIQEQIKLLYWVLKEGV